MTPPRLLDLFCGAGGAGEGYRRAGFDVTGVDNRPMPNNPHRFIQADALEYVAVHGHEYDVIHASPPCQAFSAITRWNEHKRHEYPQLIEDTRRLLNDSGKPYVIENVVGSPLHTTIRLCGASFGLRVARHRDFESNVMLFSRPCECRQRSDLVGVYGDHPQNSRVSSTGSMRRAATLADGQDAMGIDWMDWRALTQAIPPAYTEFIGRQLMDYLTTREAA